MTLKAILFDKDGTLLDFDATFAPATALVLEDLAQGDPLQMQRMADMVGFDLKDATIQPGAVLIAGSLFNIATALLPQAPLREQEKLTERLNELYIKHTKFTLVPVPGLQETLEKLRAMSLIMGVATNDSEQAARDHLAQLGASAYFDYVVGFDSGFGEKPDPGMVTAFVKQTGYRAEEVAMVGDSSHDCIAGKAANCLAIGVLTGGAIAEELQPHADVILDSINDLPNFVRS